MDNSRPLVCFRRNDSRACCSTTTSHWDTCVASSGSRCNDCVSRTFNPSHRIFGAPGRGQSRVASSKPFHNLASTQLHLRLQRLVASYRTVHTRISSPRHQRCPQLRPRYIHHQGDCNQALPRVLSHIDMQASICRVQHARHRQLRIFNAPCVRSIHCRLRASKRALRSCSYIYIRNQRTHCFPAFSQELHPQ